MALNSGPGAHTFGLYVGLVAGIAVFVAFALFLVELIASVVRQDGRGITKALSGLVVAFLGTTIAISVTVALLDAVDALSNGVLQVALGQNMNQLGKALLGAGVAATFTNPAATLLFALLVLVCVVIVWAALMVRKLLIIIAAVFAPLAFAGGTSRLTSSWVRRWIESTLALILSKLILIFIFIIGYGILIGGLGEPAHPSAGQRVTNIAIGALTLAMAGLAPWMALKTVHFAGAHFEHLHAQSQNVTAGAAKAAGMASPQKLARHLGSPGEGGSAGGGSNSNGSGNGANNSNVAASGQPKTSAGRNQRGRIQRRGGIRGRTRRRGGCRRHRGRPSRPQSRRPATAATAANGQP